MRRDIFAAAFFGVVADKVIELLQRRGEIGQAFFHAFEGRAVSHEYSDHGGQIIGGPIAAHVGLARAYAAAKSGHGVKPRVVHGDHGFDRKGFGGAAENMFFGAFQNRQFALRDAA